MMSILIRNWIPTISKQIFLALGLFFPCSQSCCNGVSANGWCCDAWRVYGKFSTRVGEATNVIESQLCVLNMASRI